MIILLYLHDKIHPIPNISILTKNKSLFSRCWFQLEFLVNSVLGFGLMVNLSDLRFCFVFAFKIRPNVPAWSMKQGSKKGKNHLSEHGPRKNEFSKVHAQNNIRWQLTNYPCKTNFSLQICFLAKTFLFVKISLEKLKSFKILFYSNVQLMVIKKIIDLFQFRKYLILWKWFCIAKIFR